MRFFMSSTTYKKIIMSYKKIIRAVRSRHKSAVAHNLKEIYNSYAVYKNHRLWGLQDFFTRSMRFTKNYNSYNVCKIFYENYEVCRKCCELCSAMLLIYNHPKGWFWLWEDILKDIRATPTASKAMLTRKSREL